MFDYFWEYAVLVSIDQMGREEWKCECHNGLEFSGDTKEQAHEQRANYYGNPDNVTLYY
jgi:hypothetical protein